MFNDIPVAPITTPLLNVGALLDIPTGHYIEDEHGMPVLNGGLGPIHSVTGPGNSFKSEILNYLFGTVLQRYGQYTYDSETDELTVPSVEGATGLWYDTESSYSYDRLAEPLSNTIDRRINMMTMTSGLIQNHIRLVQGHQINSEQIFARFRDISAERRKTRKKGLQTAFYDAKQSQYMTMQPPIYGIWDSLSEAKSTDIEEKFEAKGNVGDMDKQTMFMRDGLVKTQMITQMPNLTMRGDIYFGIVAHNTKEGPKMEMHAPTPPRLSYSAAGRVDKGVGPKFDFINYLKLEIARAAPYPNSSSDKSARYPLTEEDRSKDQKGFMRSIVTMTRNKTGTSGIVLSFVMVQGEGLQSTLTEFDFLREQKFGWLGNDQNYQLMMCPDINLSRTTVRQKLMESPKLRRAINFMSELRQIKLYWKQKHVDNYYMDPEEMIKAITDKGFDWDILLDTRDYWCFREHERALKPYLSTGALVKMARTDWKPHWYDNAVAEKAKLAKAT